MQHVSNLCYNRSSNNSPVIDNTNSKHLELYSVMAKYDNAGFPLSYCLLSTASAIDQGKRTKALAAWAVCLKAAYDINPIFVHVDKDMAEITMAKQVWSSELGKDFVVLVASESREDSAGKWKISNDGIQCSEGPCRIRLHRCGLWSHRSNRRHRQ